MASQNLSGFGAQYPAMQQGFPNSFVLGNGALIDATGEKIAFSGLVWFAERTGTKDISRVGFLFGAVTKAGGSGLTVSLQNPSTAAGGPMQPDETQDQTVAVANGDANFATSTWCRTGALSANRTVNFGEALSVVIEFDGSGRLGADSAIVQGISAIGGAAGPHHQGVFGLKTAGAWAALQTLMNVILEFDDGTFGTLSGAQVVSAVGALVFASDNATADEYALEFSVPFPCKIEGGYFYGILSGTAGEDAEFILYSGTTAMATAALEGRYQAGSGLNRYLYALFSEQQTLAANTVYRLALRPTTTTGVSLTYFDVSAAGHLIAHPGGTALVLNSRLNQGAWIGPVTTRRPMIGMFLSALDDGAGAGGGGLLRHPGMAGGIHA